jgi:hypothetical protein
MIQLGQFLKSFYVNILLKYRGGYTINMLLIANNFKNQQIKYILILFYNNYYYSQS